MSDSLATQNPADLAALNYGDMAQAGYENVTPQDVLIPFWTILQALSPQVTPGTPEYIEGARTGQLFNTATKEVIDGAKGILFIPCTTQHVFTEWRPRKAGGGFVGQHSPDSEIVRSAIAASTEFGKYKHQTEQGANDLVESFYMFGMQVDEALQIIGPAVISITSTKIKPYKQIMTTLRMCKVRAPLFANVLRVTVAMDNNAKGTFGNFVFNPYKGDVISSLLPPQVGEQPNPLLLAGKKLSDEINAGRLHADTSESGSGASSSDVPF